MKPTIMAAALAAGVLLAGSSIAEPWTDYTPHKGVWHVQTIKVDPNHIDDYLVGLKKTWAPGEEVSKKHGLIDSYQVMVKMNPADGGGNIVLIEHYPDMSTFEPNKERDMMLQKEVMAIMSKEKMDYQVREYEKYRAFVSDEYWNDVEFTK
jgi:hypothetical protein